MPNFAYTLPARALPAPGAGLSRASTAPSGPGASRAASLGRAASGPAPAAGGPGRQGSLLALYVTEPVITLVAGLLKGDHTVAQALSHGDFGLGTLDQLDGEVVVLNGVAYHQNETGTHQLLGHERSPFMTVTWFDRAYATSAQLAAADSFDTLQAQLLDAWGSRNCVFAVRITGKLPTLRVRVVCKQPDGTPLVEAAAKQLVFNLREEEGDLVGFWCPPYSGPGIQVPGFHLHYLSADRQRGGHVLQLSLAPGAAAQWVEIHRCIVDLPSSDAFMHHSLNMERVKEELHAAEADHT